jgi:acyl carrier protein
MQDIRPQVRAFIQDNFIMGSRGPQFGDADSFLERHIIDSTGFLELITFLEDTWKFTVEDEEMVPENLDSLDAIQAYVARKLGA